MVKCPHCRIDLTSCNKGENMPQGWEWIIILVIVVLVFGVGRLGRLGEDLGSGIRAFREGLAGDDEEETNTEEEN